MIEAFTSESPVDRDAIELAPKRAVEYLAQKLMERRSETLQVVHEIDADVGDDYFQIRLEDRMSDAVKAELPWEFSFALTGGWRRARQELAVLRSYDDADLLLAAIAVNQVLFLDADTAPHWLDEVGRLLHKDAAWLMQTLAILKDGRVIVAKGVGLRCPHLRFALVVLNAMYLEVRSERGKLLVSLVQAALGRVPPLHGISWLLNELRFVEAFRFDGKGSLITRPIFDSIVTRCWKADRGEARREAIFALESLLRWSSECSEDVNAHVAVLPRMAQNG